MGQIKNIKLLIVTDIKMIEDETDAMIDLGDQFAKQPPYIRKLLEKIVGVVLIDVKKEFACGKIDPTVQNLRAVLEESLNAKLQEEQLLLGSNACIGYEQSLINEPNCDTGNGDDAKNLQNEIATLVESLNSKGSSVIPNESLKRMEQVDVDAIIPNVANVASNEENLEKENRQLKHKLKCMECNYETMKKNYMTEIDKNTLRNPRNRKSRRED